MSETTEETLSAKADRLARDAVKAELAEHEISYTRSDGTSICICDAHWPCGTVRNLSAAEEAISEAEEEEQRIANGPYYCGVETRAMRYVDPEPAEYCETEVDHEGDLCTTHESESRAESERDDDAWERMKDARYDD